MKRIFCWTLLMLTVLVASATRSDSICIAGRVSALSGQPVDAIIITVLHPSDSSVVAYCMTDDSGCYSMTFVAPAQEVLIRMTGFNVKRYIRKVKAVNQKLDLFAEEKSTTLREVQIQAQKIWGNRDTLNYLVAAYSTEHDRTIGDILKQLPGITIDNGVIKYQGTPINHFYVENMDVLQGRYNIVTNGMKAEDVATVQVLENHEHVKALQDQVPPESAAINLKLKDKAKGVWTASLGLGLGYDDAMMWNNEANAMYFGKQRQHIIYYGNDNTGNGANRSTRYYGGNSLENTILTDILYPGSSPVGSSLFNNEHAFHSSNLHKLSKTAQLHYDLSYNHDVQKRSAYQQTTYLLPGSDVRILSEDISSRRTTNDVDMSLTYENNADKEFIKNTLYLSGRWYNANGIVSKDTEKIQQQASNHNLGLSNHTHWVHRTSGGGGFEFSSKNSVQTSPQSLAISEGMEARQDVELLRVKSDNDFSLIKDLRRHRWSIVPTASLNLNYVGMTSMLQSSVSDNGKMDYINVEANAGAMLRYVKNEFRLTFRLPLTMSYTNVINEVSKLKVRCSPSFSLLWKANDYWTISCGGNYGVQQTPWNQLVTSYIMSNYRTTGRYVSQLSDNHSATAQAKFNYKDIFNSFFSYIQASASRSWSNVIYGTTIDEDAHTILQAKYMPHHDEIYSITGNVCKEFDWKKTRLELNANYTRINSNVLRQSVCTKYHNDAFSVKYAMSVNIVRALRLGYDCNYSLSRSASSDYVHTIQAFDQNAKLDVSFIRNKLLMGISASHSHNSGFLGKKNYVFMNCSLTYKCNKKLDFLLQADNLFNTHTFISRLDNQMTQYFNVYHLRTRSFILTAHINL